MAGAGAPKEAKVLGGEKALQVPSSSRQSVGRSAMVFVDFPVGFPSNRFPPEVTVDGASKRRPVTGSFDVAYSQKPEVR